MCLLKVAYITMAFPAPTETFATNDVRTLLTKGVDVTVHSLRLQNRESEALADDRGVATVRRTYGSWKSLVRGLTMIAQAPAMGASLFWLIVSSCWRHPEHLLKSLAIMPRVLEIFGEIEQLQPDVVHVYWGHYPSLVGLLVVDHFPHVVCTMSLAAYDLEAHYAPSKLLAKRVPMVRTLGHVNVATIRDDYGVPSDRIDVIYDGVDLARLPSWGEREKIRERVAIVSRLVPEKGVDDALEVFARANERLSSATLKIMGDGPERSNLERIADSLGIGEVVEFLGHVGHDRVLAELVEAEVLLFMSKKSSERLPNVVKEAMGCGAVCLATPTPGISELIRHGETGWIVPAGAVDEAVERLEGALTDKGDGSMARMRADAVAHIRHHFDLERSVERYVEKWTQLVRERTRDLGESGVA